MDSEDWTTFFRLCLKENRCCNCFAKGHKWKECPKKLNLSVKEQNKGSSKNYMVMSFSSREGLPRSLTVELGLSRPSGETVVSAVVDTGAQGGMYISKDVVNKLGILTMELEQKILLRGYDGSPVEVLSKSTEPLHFHIAGQKFCDVFKISLRLPSQVIIGLDWLQGNHAVIHCDRLQLAFNGQKFIDASGGTEKAGKPNGGPDDSEHSNLSPGF